LQFQLELRLLRNQNHHRRRLVLYHQRHLLRYLLHLKLKHHRHHPMKLLRRLQRLLHWNQLFVRQYRRHLHIQYHQVFQQ
jgi:hypothetical protein